MFFGSRIIMLMLFDRTVSSGKDKGVVKEKGKPLEETTPQKQTHFS
jgi:hypothetical protein